MGWFPDQQNPGIEWYYDGQQWTAWRQAGGGPAVPIVPQPGGGPAPAEPPKKMAKSGVIAITALLAIPVVAIAAFAWSSSSGRSTGEASAACEAFFIRHDLVDQQLRRVPAITNDSTMVVLSDDLEKIAVAVEGIDGGAEFGNKRDAYVTALRTVAASAREGVAASSADLPGAQDFGQAGLAVAEFCNVTRDDLVALAEGQAMPRVDAAPPAVTTPPEPVKSAAQQLDEQAEAQGFHVVESGSLYIRALDPGEYTCGYWDCLYYEVYTARGCPSGLYLEASVMRGGAVVGMANDMVSGVRAGESAFLQLEDYQGVGDQFRVNEVNCY